MAVEPEHEGTVAPGRGGGEESGPQEQLLEATAQYFCDVLLVGSESLDRVCSQGVRDHMRTRTPGGGDHWGDLGALRALQLDPAASVSSEARPRPV